MNLNLTAEDFINAIKEAEKIIPKRPDITIKNAKVTGVKLNKKMIDSIPKAKEPVINFYEGLKVYQDDSVKSPQFIVEGEIEPKKKILKWEDLEFTGEEQTMKVILNGSVHFLSYYRNMFGDNLCMIDNTGITIWKENKDFFNDLRLEMVE